MTNNPSNCPHGILDGVGCMICDTDGAAESCCPESSAEAKATDYLVTVCSACKRASCWQAIFFCDDFFEAGTVQMYKSELLLLGLENESYLVSDDELSKQAGRQ